MILEGEQFDGAKERRPLATFAAEYEVGEEIGR